MTDLRARSERRLAAILAADVVGSSRMIEADETYALAAIRAVLSDLIATAAQHGGRLIKTMGDGALIEFASPVSAVTCAAAVQQAVTERASKEPEDRRVLLRIGVNLGDVVAQADGDLYGDGVNVAARLEGIANPGGIAISAKVHDELQGKLALAFEDRGEQTLKNIARPVRVYASSGTASRSARSPAKRLTLPDKPSIAVLPFTNMSGDPEQEFFVDGLVEDVLTSLSKVSDLFVVALNSTFVYKGKAVDLREVATQLGVRYVVEGSVRKGGQRIRITVQLIDGQTGSHLWAERYDRSVEDIFDVQDDITREITTALQVRLTEGEQVELRRRQTSNLLAWEAFTRGQAHLRTFTLADNIQARRFLERALSLDPQFAAAWALLAWTYLMEGRLGWSKSNEAALEKGADAALRGIAINENASDAWSMLGGIRVYQRRFEEALEAGQRSIELAPNAADHLAIHALTLNFVGRPQEALTLIERAMRLSPFYPDFYLGFLGISYRLLGRIDEAIAADLRRLERNPANVFSDLRLAALYAQRGDLEKGRFHVKEALRKNPSYSVRQVRVTDPYQDEAEMARYIDLLRSVGLSE